MKLCVDALYDFHKLQTCYESGLTLLNFCDVRNIAKFSFLLHKSITYLDLSQQEYSAYTNRFPVANSYYQKFLCTEQGLQDHLRPVEEFKKTALLQIYHLDLSKERESVSENVEDRTVNRNRVYDCATVYDIVPEKSTYGTYLTKYMIIALEENTDKSSIVKLCLKLMKDKDFHDLFNIPGCRKVFFPYLLKHCSDSELVIKVFKMLDFDNWIIYLSTPDQLEISLYHVYALKEVEKMLDKDLIYMCFANSKYKNVEVLLKYQNFPEISSRSYEFAFNNLKSKRCFPKNFFTSAIVQEWITGEWDGRKFFEHANCMMVEWNIQWLKQLRVHLIFT